MSTEVEPLAVSPDTLARMIERGRSFVFAHMKAGNIKYVEIGDGRRVPMEEARRIVREGLPQIKKAKAA